MTPGALAIILLWLATFVAGQLLFKRAMESSRATGFRIAGQSQLSASDSRHDHFVLSKSRSAPALRSELSLSVQGSSIIIITLLAAVILKEKLTPRLIIGTLLITAGVVLRFNELTRATSVPVRRN